VKVRSRDLYSPSPAHVQLSAEGIPVAVEGARVLALRESWLLEDRWWSEQPLRRRYWELLLESGRNVVVFCELSTRRWFRQL
jgi:hypothetical protein